MLELLAEEHLRPLYSSILIDGFGTLGVAIVTGLALRQRTFKLREAAAADASTDVNRELTPGPCVVYGVVEYAQDAKWAVRIDVDQEGDEYENSGVWQHKWTEKNRRVHVAPFYARLASGRRVRIEPSSDVMLVDEMNGVVRVNLTKRTRYAELVPGETIYASGQLVRAPDPENIADSGGYRNSPESFVLRPSQAGRMLLSTEPLGARFRERAAFHASAANWFVVLALFLHAVFFGFHVRRYLGHTENARLVNREPYIARDPDGNEFYRYRLELQSPDGFVLTSQVDHHTFNLAPIGETIPIRRVHGALSSQSLIGPGVTSHTGALIFPAYLLVVWIAYRRWEKASRPWYEREVNEGGSGRLEDSLAKEQGSSARS